MSSDNRKKAHDWSLVALLAATCLSGCSDHSDQSKESTTPAPPAAQTQTADLHSKSNSHSKSARTNEGHLMLARRGMLLNDKNGLDTSSRPTRGFPQPTTVQPQRMTPREAAVRRLKSWAPIKIETQAIDVWMKSSWSDGQLNVRLAMLGPQDSLTQFVNGVNGCELEFTDPSGGQTMTFNIQPTDFQWAPATVNNGTPTMQFESSIDCPIEAYEQSTNWNFKWN